MRFVTSMLKAFGSADLGGRQSAVKTMPSTRVLRSQGRSHSMAHDGLTRGKRINTEDLKDTGAEGQHKVISRFWKITHIAINQFF